MEREEADQWKQLRKNYSKNAAEKEERWTITINHVSKCQQLESGVVVR